MGDGWFPGAMSRGIGCGSVCDPEERSGLTSLYVCGVEGEEGSYGGLVCNIVVKPTVIFKGERIYKVSACTQMLL